MALNSRGKGQAGEREFARVLSDEGYSAQRCGVQGGGNHGWNADVVCPDLPGIHFEVKRTEKLSLHDALAQAERDAAKGGRLPVVAHRKNRGGWVFILPRETFFRLLRESNQPLVRAREN